MHQRRVSTGAFLGCFRRPNDLALSSRAVGATAFQLVEAAAAPRDISGRREPAGEAVVPPQPVRGPIEARRPP